MKRIHVLGMAKSCLDLRDGKSRNLELDFLRLAIAVRDYRNAGEAAKGYLLVLKPGIAETARRWASKYRTGNDVEVLQHDPIGQDLDALEAEKIANAIGLLKQHKVSAAEEQLSVAKRGKELGEKALVQAIRDPLHHGRCRRPSSGRGETRLVRHRLRPVRRA